MEKHCVALARRLQLADARETRLVPVAQNLLIPTPNLC